MQEISFLLLAQWIVRVALPLSGAIDLHAQTPVRRIDHLLLAAVSYCRIGVSRCTRSVWIACNGSSFIETDAGVAVGYGEVWVGG